MSYARFGPDSDVYVYPSTVGIICHACRLNAMRRPFRATMRAVLETLRKCDEKGRLL